MVIMKTIDTLILISPCIIYCWQEDWSPDGYDADNKPGYDGIG